MKTKRGPSTSLIHGPRSRVVPGNEPLVEPIYQSVKFHNATLQDLGKTGPGQRFIYSRVENPTVQTLERQLAEMQGRAAGLATSSGVAALSAVLLALLKAGDHVIFFLESYKPTRMLIRDLLGKFGVESTGIFHSQISDLESFVRAGHTKLLVFESPSNPVLRIPDIPSITAICRKHGIVSVLDNTLAGPHNHGQFDVDLFVHSLTKFISGHGDVMGGAILGSSDLISKIRPTAVGLGATLDPHAAFLVLRGLRTYLLRYPLHCANALAVARALENHPHAENVIYPGLVSHPDHDLAARQMKDFGGVVCFDIKGIAPEAFLNHLKLFQLAPSLGSIESLATPVRSAFGGDLSSQECDRAGLSPRTVRLSVGLEDSVDLIHDLESALT